MTAQLSATRKTLEVGAATFAYACVLAVVFFWIHGHMAVLGMDTGMFLMNLRASVDGGDLYGYQARPPLAPGLQLAPFIGLWGLETGTKAWAIAASATMIPALYLFARGWMSHRWALLAVAGALGAGVQLVGQATHGNSIAPALALTLLALRLILDHHRVGGGLTWRIPAIALIVGAIPWLSQNGAIVAGISLSAFALGLNGGRPQFSIIAAGAAGIALAIYPLAKWYWPVAPWVTNELSGPGGVQWSIAPLSSGFMAAWIFTTLALWRTGRQRDLAATLLLVPFACGLLVVGVGSVWVENVHYRSMAWLSLIAPVFVTLLIRDRVYNRLRAPRARTILAFVLAAWLILIVSFNVYVVSVSSIGIHEREAKVLRDLAREGGDIITLEYGHTWAIGGYLGVNAYHAFASDLWADPQRAEMLSAIGAPGADCSGLPSARWFVVDVKEGLTVWDGSLDGLLEIETGLARCGWEKRDAPDGVVWWERKRW